MSTPSDSTIKGKFDEALGNVKQSVGETFGDQKMANDGATDQVKGHAEEAWGSVKEGAADLKAQHEAAGEAKAHDARESVTSTAESVKDSIKAGVAHLTGKPE